MCTIKKTNEDRFFNYNKQYIKVLNKQLLKHLSDVMHSSIYLRYINNKSLFHMCVGKNIIKTCVDHTQSVSCLFEN